MAGHTIEVMYYAAPGNDYEMMSVRVDTSYGTHIPAEVKFPNDDEWTTIDYTPINGVLVGGTEWDFSVDKKGLARFTNPSTKAHFETYWDECPDVH